MDPKKPEGSTGSKEAAVPDKPLGRGLEQISHLFLTQKLNDSRADNPIPRRLPDAALAPTPVRQDSRSILLQPSTSVTRARLVAMLREFQDALEAGLRVIDVLLPCHPYGEMDLLALDRSNEITIIDFETASNDALLLRGLAHCEWLTHNLPNLRRMHAGKTINLSAAPRLFLLAPAFSPLMMSAACQLTQPQKNWVRYQLFDTGGATGIHFEPIGSL